MAILKALNDFFHSLSQRNRVLTLFFTSASFFMLYSLTKFNLGVNINLFFILINFLFIVYSVPAGLLSLMLTISLFGLVESNAIVTFDIVLFFKGYYLLLFFLYVLMLIQSKIFKNLKSIDRKILFAYVSLIFIYMVVGVVSGIEMKIVFIDDWYMFMFWTLPLALPLFLKDSDIPKILGCYLVLLIMVSFYYYRARFTGIYNHGETRVYTRQIFIFSYILPLLFAWFLNSIKKEKLIVFIVFLISIGTVIISQTRIVFAGILLSFLIGAVLNHRFNHKKIVLAAAVMFATIFSLDFLPFHGLEAFDRIISIKYFYMDASFLMRFVTTYDVYLQHGLGLIKGMGLGHMFHLRPNLLYAHHVEGWVDIGYISIAAKMGIIGLASFLAIIARIFYCSFYCYKKDLYINRYHKIVVIGVLSAIPSLLLQFFLFSLLIKYIYVITITPFFALSLYYYNKIKEGETLS